MAINDDSNDLNKLCGISFGNPHKNSLRFAWRPDFNRPGEIMIYAYWYANGQRRSLYIGNIYHNEYYNFEIIIGTPIVAFTVSQPGAVFREGRKSAFVNYAIPRWLIGHFMWPYFGGNNTAPHDMSIDLDIL